MEARSRHQSARIATVVSGVLRALSICTPAALLDAPATLARAVEPAPLTADIPAQPLAQALEAFARQTALHLVYVSDVVREQRSHAVAAGLGANEALARMLQGTGLKFEYLTPRSIHILVAVGGRNACRFQHAAELERTEFFESQRGARQPARRGALFPGQPPRAMNSRSKAMRRSLRSARCASATSSGVSRAGFHGRRSGPSNGGVNV